MKIPPGQNAFTWKPTSVFDKTDHREISYARRGVAGGVRRARDSKGTAVYGLKTKPENMPAKYKEKT